MAPSRRAREDAWRRASALALTGVVCVFLTASCRSPEEKFAAHLERAEQLLQGGADDEADVILELHNALELRPDHARANLLLARILIRHNRLDDARFYFEAAHAADPDDDEAALEVARLIHREYPTRARTLVDAVIERHPNSARAHVARAELQLGRGALKQAMLAARRAVVLDEELPDAHWQLGRVHAARILKRELNGRPSGPGMYSNALASYDRYLELGGTNIWRVQLARALTLAKSPTANAGDEAEVAFRTSAAAAATLPRGSLEWSLAEAADFARRARRRELLHWSIESQLELNPGSLALWDELAQLSSDGAGSFREVYRRLAQERPDDARAQLRYAGIIRANDGTDAALDFLYEKLRQKIEPPLLLGVIADLERVAGRPEARARALERLRSNHPRHPSAAIAGAQLALENNRPADAARVLRELIERASTADANRMLAAAERRLGRLGPAIVALDRAIALTPGRSGDLERTRARLLHDSRRFRDARRELRRLQRTYGPLNPRETWMLARCWYETGKRREGRRLLRGLVQRQSPPLYAIVEYARRERNRVGERKLVLAALERAPLAQHGAWVAVEIAVSMEIESGRIQAALTRLNSLAAKRPSDGRVFLLRAIALRRAGELEAARADAWLAFQLEPGRVRVVELLAELYADPDSREKLLALLRRASRETTLGAVQLALIGRLQLAADPKKARPVLEISLRRAPLPATKAYLARLLADGDRRDRRRALLLATQARRAAPYDPVVRDALGYAQLRIGRSGAALREFTLALEMIDFGIPSPAPLHYHAGLALGALGRNREAGLAFDRAIALDVNLAGVAEARKRLSRSDRTPEAS